MQLSYREWGPKDPDPKPQEEIDSLVLLHGMGGTGSLWRPIAAHLEEQFQVIAPDQRGHGGSRPVPAHDFGFTPEDYARDIAELLDQKGISKATVIGHSMGVRTATALAHLRPDLVQGLILVDLGFSGPAGGGLGAPLYEFLKKIPMHFASRADARTYLETNCPDASIGQYLMAVATPQAPGVSDITFPFDREALLKTLESAETSSIRDWMPGILNHGIRILALRGETSRVWSAEDFEREKAFFHGLIRISFETFSGTGHGLPFEKRAAFLERVQAFIRECAKPH
jgi:N-formylmaleamate deformylase